MEAAPQGCRLRGGETTTRRGAAPSKARSSEVLQVNALAAFQAFERCGASAGEHAPHETGRAADEAEEGNSNDDHSSTGRTGAGFMPSAANSIAASTAPTVSAPKTIEPTA